MMSSLTPYIERPFLLVVSEERDYRLEIKRYFEQEFPDLDLVVESSPIEAIARRNSINKPMIGIFDYELPDLDGIMLGKYLYESSRYPSECFVITEGDDHHIQEKVLDEDLLYFTKKPPKGGKEFNLGSLFAAKIRKAIRDLRKCIPIDGLTGLYTRDFAMELFRHDFARAKRVWKPLAMIVADVNNFKFINDTFGHQVGDDVLRKLGVAFSHLRQHYDIIARMGDKGDEIVIVMPDTAYAGAKKVIKRIESHIQEEVRLEIAPGVFLPISVAMGSSFLLPTYMGSSPDLAAQKMLRSGDKAMYKVKMKEKPANLRLLKKIAKEIKK